MDEDKGKIVKFRARKKPSEDAKLRPVDIHLNLAEAISRSGLTLLPPFPRRYGVLEPAPGTRIPVTIGEDDLLTIVPKDTLAHDLMTYCTETLAAIPEYYLKWQQLKEAVDFYLSKAKPLDPDAIALTRWQGERGLTYSRLPWELRDGETPNWDQLLGRMSNRAAFEAWVGSLFSKESSLQNYIWCHGEGGDGKGSINRFLARVFGPSYRSKHPPSTRHGVDRFWTYGLMGARLVVLPDCDDHTFVTKGLFKALTGGDPIEVEAKGQMSFTARLSAKFLIFSNERPTVSCSEADMRRIIYCELGKAPEFDPEFEEKLWAEGGYFLTRCIKSYAEAYPTHGAIKSSREELDALIADIEESQAEVFNKWFTLDSEQFVSPQDMLRIYEHEWPRQTRKHSAFKEWMKRTYKIEAHSNRVKEEGGGQRAVNGGQRVTCRRERRYWGIVLKKKAPVSFYDALDGDV